MTYCDRCSKEFRGRPYVFSNGNVPDLGSFCSRKCYEDEKEEQEDEE